MRLDRQRYQDCLTLARKTGLTEQVTLDRFFGPLDRTWRPVDCLTIRQAWWMVSDAMRAGQAPARVGLRLQVGGSHPVAVRRLHREINFWAAALAGAPLCAREVTGADALSATERSRLDAHLNDLLPCDESGDLDDCDSILAQGPSIRGLAWGRLEYRFDPDDHDAPFDAAAVTAQGRELLREEAVHAWVAAALSTGSLGRSEYASRFGEPWPPALSDALTALQDLGLVEERGTAWALSGPSPTERSAALLFLADSARLQSAWRESDLAGPAQFVQDPRERLTLVIAAADTEVKVVLTTREPGFRAFAHSGSFAFYVPSSRPESTCRHTPLEEAVLGAFRQLFTDVVTRQSPESLDELKRGLLARGQRLRLTGRGPFHGLVVQLHPGEQDHG